MRGGVLLGFTRRQHSPSYRCKLSFFLGKITFCSHYLPGYSSLGWCSLHPRWMVKVSRGFDSGPDFLPRVYVDVICHNFHSLFKQLQATFCLSSKQSVARRRQHSPSYRMQTFLFAGENYLLLSLPGDFPGNSSLGGVPSSPVQCSKPPRDLTLGRTSSQEFMSMWFVTISTHSLSNYTKHILPIF